MRFPRLSKLKEHTGLYDYDYADVTPVLASSRGFHDKPLPLYSSGWSSDNPSEGKQFVQLILLGLPSVSLSPSILKTVVN